MVKKTEIITEEEWFRRMMQKKIYDVLFIDWDSGVTRVVDKFTGNIFDVHAKEIGNKIMLEVRLLE